MECTDRQIPPRNGILPVRDEEQRQHLGENLERQEHDDNAHPQLHDDQRIIHATRFHRESSGSLS
jgi:hypothetical protein